MGRQWYLLAALVLSMAANLWLARQLRSCRSQGPSLTVQEARALVEALPSRPQGPLAAAPYTAGLALSLSDCAACFDFLKLFASLCHGRQGLCQVLLVHADREQAEQLRRNFDLALPVEAVAALPEGARCGPTPVVWLEHQGAVVACRQVPPEPEAQVGLLLELLRQASAW